METLSIANWSPADYCLTMSNASTVAEEVYARACRADFDAPGFCLIDCGDCTSSLLRQHIVALKAQLAELHRARAGRELVFVSAARFDQQESTKLHRDG